MNPLETDEVVWPHCRNQNVLSCLSFGCNMHVNQQVNQWIQYWFKSVTEQADSLWNNKVDLPVISGCGCHPHLSKVCVHLPLQCLHSPVLPTSQPATIWLANARSSLHAETIQWSSPAVSVVRNRSLYLL